MKPELDSYIKVFRQAARSGKVNPWVGTWDMYCTEPEAATILGLNIKEMEQLRKKGKIYTKYVFNGHDVTAMYSIEELYMRVCEKYST